MVLNQRIYMPYFSISTLPLSRVKRQTTWTIISVIFSLCYTPLLVPLLLLLTFLVLSLFFIRSISVLTFTTMTSIVPCTINFGTSDYLSGTFPGVSVHRHSFEPWFDSTRIVEDSTCIQTRRNFTLPHLVQIVPGWPLFFVFLVAFRGLDSIVV